MNAPPDGQSPSPEELTRAALTWCPMFIGGLVWAFARHEDKLQWLQEAYAKAFGPIAGLYEGWTRAPGYGDALNAALHEVRNPPKDVLDIATGTGYAAFTAARRFPDARIVGVDVSEEMIGIAQHQSIAEGVQAEFKLGDSSSLPSEDATFDLAMVHNSIVHPEEMMRVLRKGGRAIVVYSFGGPWVSMAWPSLAERFQAAGAEYIWQGRAGAGFFGVARR